MRLAGRCCCWPGPPTQNNRAGWCWLVQAGGGGGRSDQRPATARQSPASPAQPAAATSQISMQQPSSSPAILTSPALTNDEPHSLVRGWWPGMGWPGTRPGHHRAQVQESSRQQTQPLSHESKLSFMTNDCHQPSPAQPSTSPAGQSTRQQAQAAQAHRHRHSRMVRWLLCRTWQPGHCSWTCSTAAAAITLHWIWAYDDSHEENNSRF